MSISAQIFKSKNGGMGQRASRWWMLLVLLALLGLVCEPVLAAGEDQDDEVDPENRLPEGLTSSGPPPAQDAASDEQSADFLKTGKPRITIDSLYPAHGPVTGDTRVTVRGGPFQVYKDSYPEPKCRFGTDDMIVAAAYTSCTPTFRGWAEKEAKQSERTALCIQCENSPASTESKPVEFTVSLTGDFSDVTSTAQFYYYEASHVLSIRPHQGPKHGDTTVHVWGENFQDFGYNITCSFGTRASEYKATVLSNNYITCKSPPSDVVQRAMPFSVSLNGQQVSTVSPKLQNDLKDCRELFPALDNDARAAAEECITFWYYNEPQVTVVMPNLGPETGGNEITLRGDNFKPFTLEEGELDISNSTYCAFTAFNPPIMTEAKILNSTRARCKAPPSYYWRETNVELTLNAQNYTNDATKYYYYKPPFLFDVQPAQGPVEGGTQVTVVGSNFNNTEEISCKFGRHKVPGKYVSSSEIMCVAPPVPEPGFVDLMISLYPGLYSSPVQYLYYKNPVVNSVMPPCGPESGFTQLVVTGENFVDLGHNQAICVFNKTIYTNATVISETEIICDSPSILNKQGYSELPDGQAKYYVVDVSIDGGLQTSQSTQRFSYHREPKVKSVSPVSGPIRGGTTMILQGSGFAQAATCRRVVRLGHLEVEPISFTSDSMTIKTPAVELPSTTVLSVSLNGQQFTSQQEVHSPKKSVTFDYYADPYASLFYPSKGPTNGGTLIKVQGYGFMLKRKHLKDQLWTRFVDPSSKQELAPATEVPADQLHVDALSWTTPSVHAAQDALLQISLNKQDWVDVKDPADDKSFGFYASPHITSITPSYGHVKATKDVNVEVAGSGFECFDDCSDLLCRFGNQPSQYIYVKGEFVESTLIKCKVPEYTKPDVLKVEVTINGESYTSDNRTYGFFDPFVLDAEPRLIATDGSTKVAIKGIGFVDSSEAKALFSNRTYPIYDGVSQGNCTKPAIFKDKHTLMTTTFKQADVKYNATDKSVLWDPVYIDVTVAMDTNVMNGDDEYTKNDVEIFYYEDPVLATTNIAESPSNIQSQVLVHADFRGNNMARLVKYATPKCRFTSAASSAKVQYTEGQIIAYPFTGNRDPALVNTVHCKTPRWKLDGEDPEKATLSISLNGQNYVGGLDFTFLRDLKVHRDIPMSGPQRRPSQVKMIGQGYRLHGRDADLKWGTQTTMKIPQAEVQDYTYTLQDFLNAIPGSQELRSYQNEARSFARVDSKMTEGGSYDIVTKSSVPSLDQGSLGGPAYVEVGLDEVLENAGEAVDGKSTTQKWVLYNYMPSSVEFYAYKEPMVQKMHPTSGLTKGGTFIEVIGAWFRYMPEYGIVPHCRFGDKIARAHFDSSVRLVCQSPPNADVSAKLPFEVSLNGVDWTNTGFEYSYYDEPIMTDIYPDMGSVQGGDEIYVKGEKFTNHTDPEEFKCRFTPVSLSIPPKTIRARYINSTTIMCPSPGGWSEADQMILQVTWNGVDYDENHFQYTFYSIHRAFPRSGPSNGRGGDIIVSGSGFREDTQPSCMLNHTQYEPVSVTKTEIRCPMPAAEGGDSFFGNVDLAVTANGITWNTFDGGFQYYDQPIVEDIYPKTGPSSGIGIINFYGENFRADYPLAELGCKIGEATGKAYYVSARQVKCVVEEIPLLAEDEEPLPAQVSLNSYSYTELTDDTYFRPYGVLHIQPSSGPTGGVTTVVAQGQGFVAEDGAVPRCRFGTPANYAIVEAEILSYTRIACRTPETLPLTPTSALPRDVPFSIAISGDEYNPWTSTSHKFRFYEQPVIEKVEPEEVEVGRIAEVYVTAADDSEFFDPMPLAPLSMGDEDSESDATAHPGGLSAIKCKFGRFGEANAVYINSTTIKCTTPPADDPPDQIYRETVVLGVAMNGYDFLEDSSTTEFTFVGTAPYISFATIVMTLLAIAFVGFAVALCTQDSFQLGRLRDAAARRGPARGGLQGQQLRQYGNSGQA